MPPAMAAPPNFAPPLRLLMRRRFAELLALLLAGLGAAVLVALSSYNPADPSFDTATTARAVNLAGPPGAIVADALMQGFGLAAFLPGLALLGWAWRIGSHRGLTMILLRIAGLLAALPLSAAVLAAIAQQSATALQFPAASGPGGAVGSVLALSGTEMAGSLLGPIGSVVALLGAGVLALLLSVIALGLTAGEWRAAGRAARGSAVQARRASGAVAQGTGTLVRLGTWLLRTVNGTKQAETPHVVQPLPPAPRQQLGIPRHEAPTTAEPGKTPLAFDRRAAPNGVPPDAPRARTEPTLAAPAPKISRFAGAKPEAAPPPPQHFEEASWELPPLSLLTPAPPRDLSVQLTPEQMEDNARLLESVLKDYGVQGEIVAIRPGPVVTLYELEPAPGTRATRVIGLSDDVARSLSVHAVRIAVVPGRSVLGIEVPNAKRETVYLSELLNSPEWDAQNAKLGIALGQDISGAPVLADMARMPHLLVAGTTGSGKSVGINAMILSLLYKLSPAECRLIMIDPKMLELSVYEGIPHLLAPVVTDPAKAISALKWTVREMERRYRAMSQLSVRNLAGYNARVAEARRDGKAVSRRVQTGFDSETNKPIFEDQQIALDPMPLIVVVIDEMADLMMVAGKDIEASVMRLAQMARAAGIHVIMATQRPSVDVITGTIKANFPTRISFRVVNKHDSRTILGEMGAEQLLGQGDMLFQADSRTTRVHGPFVSDREVEDVVAFLREQGEPDYQDDITEAPPEPEQLALSGIAGAEDDEKNLFDMAVDIVTRDGKASTSYLQRCLKIGYNRAANLIEQMEREGIITAPNHVGKRDILARRRGEDE